MPISADDLKEVREALKRLDQIVAGLQAQAESEEGRERPASEPEARRFRLV